MEPGERVSDINWKATHLVHNSFIFFLGGSQILDLDLCNIQGFEQ